MIDCADHELNALRLIAEGTAAATGDAFFRTLVERLATAIGTTHAFVAKFLPPGSIRTLAYWSEGRLVPNVEYELAGTPCEEVIHGSHCFYPRGLEEKYAEAEPGIQSYLGVPLISTDGRVLGHLCAFDELPMADQPRTLAVFKIFAARAAAELDRLDMETELRHKEEELRDLFDEAPIAYVHETLDSRFLRANRAARRILGIALEDVPNVIGKSLVPNTPDARRRMHEAFESVGKGTDTGGVLLELRRKDNGGPIWIQWWSNPDRSGAYTRTMFIDVTERVLLEQEQARIKAQNLYLQEELKSVHNFEEIIGASEGLVNVLDSVRLVASTDATVLLTGESGTGKELIARALHSASKRADKPFIKVNCAALALSLIESELFGHERGAFSGAIQKRIGRFELAHAGTLFLDEIGEVPPEVQVKLLRVLQEREFERVGGNQVIKADVRVIAATNRDLGRGVREGRFRADLFYRLNVFPVHLPPLRERVVDIPLLVHFFVQRHAPRVGRHIESVDPDSMRRLIAYPWPGNIRELENVVERALILGSKPVLEIHIDPPGPADADSADLDAIQREHILKVLDTVNWIIEGGQGAAVRLGLKPGTLRHRMKKLGIRRSAS
ncbi:MAG: sigma 54-interacting transcriptional regulator [Gammaproteobacteria bacterium]|nr:sigma 54-interacting transcriptional regulator [Gammaproteobacteria bacterium]